MQRPPPPVKASHNQARPARAQGGRAIGRARQVQMPDKKKHAARLAEGEGVAVHCTRYTIGGSKDGPAGGPCSMRANDCGEGSTGARAWSAAKKRECGHARCRLAIGVPRRGYQTGWSRGVGWLGWEDWAVGQWPVGAASKARGRSSGNLGPRFGMEHPICQVDDRGSSIAEWMRIGTDVCCTVQDHHPSSIIISKVNCAVLLQNPEAKAEARGTGRG